MAATTLRDFHNSLPHGIQYLWICGVGCPAGQDYNHDTDTDDEEEYCDMPELIGQFDTDDGEGGTSSLWDLEGEVTDGQWVWDGEGDPTDERGNTIYNIKAN